MPVPFDEFQKKRNSDFYRQKGTEFRTEFKTFASDARFARALARNFHGIMKKSEKEIINVYEFGVGEGSLGTRFLLELRKAGEKLAEKTVYHFCDFSDGLVKNAVKRADAFGFNVDGITYDAGEGEPKFLKNADYVLANEFYDDLPAKLLCRKGRKIMEVVIEEDERKLALFEGEDEIINYMLGMPEGYWIPVNIVAKKHLDYCLRESGHIDIFDYGFSSIDEIKSVPADMWNNSIVREFGTQVTTDVNFNFIAGKEMLVESQLEFVERVLGGKFHEVETDRLRYMTEEEIKLEEKELEKHGYLPGFHREMKEERGYLHLGTE